MKEKYRKCLKCGESPSDNARVILHRFPKPGRTNKLRCEAWAKFCFPDSEWHLPEFQKKLFTEHRMLCNKHFRMSSFMDITRRRLIKTATPDPESEKIFNETKNLNASVLGEVSKPLLHNTTLLSIDESSKELDIQKLKDSENGNSIRETVIKEPPSKKIRNETKNITVSEVTEKKEPKQNIPQVLKKKEPTQNIPQVSKKIEPTQIIPQESKKIEPTHNIPQVSKKIEPTQNIPQVSKKIELTQIIPQVSNKKEPTQSVPQVSKPLLYNTTFLNTDESSKELDLQKLTDSENGNSIRETVIKEPPSKKIRNETKNIIISVPEGTENQEPTQNIPQVSKKIEPTQNILQVSKKIQPTQNISQVKKKKEPTQNIPQVSKKKEPTQNMPQVSKKIEPTQIIPQVSKKIEPTQNILQVSKKKEPTQNIPQVSKKKEPTQNIPQVSKKIEPTQIIPQESKKIEPTQNIPQVSKKIEPTQNIPQVSKKKEPTQNVPQVSKPLLYNTTFLNTEESSEGLELRKSNDSENVYSIYRETDKEEPSKLPSEYNRSLYIKCKKQSNKIKQLRKIICELKEKLHARKMSTGPVLKNKLKKFKIKTNTCEWDMNTKIIALKLYKRSQPCYNLLRKIICLPDPSTLRQV